MTSFQVCNRAVARIVISRFQCIGMCRLAVLYEYIRDTHVHTSDPTYIYPNRN